jgi:hypothetical protein
LNDKTISKEVLRIKALIDDARQICYEQLGDLSTDKQHELMGIKPSVILRGKRLNMATVL